MGEDSLERSTSYQDIRAVFSSFFRFGHVTHVDNVKRLAKVKFDDLGFTSDWLPVLINRDFIPGYDVEPQRTEFEEGGSGAAAYEKHKHDLKILPYMPKKNEQVACIFEPVRNGRGLILGGVAPWQ